ncbi:DMT family transporter [Hoeflea poritis]|uniref:DMT family transporter n=1 Tax=Hoeflea poritis TaxID=2993659 RepID=A0ABT4VGF2_9HYPH|nr:DMT family transporter [Hoeflea poritis]MDA4843779.1 DMT family transporter [Hoeflea poritis]
MTPSDQPIGNSSLRMPAAYAVMLFTPLLFASNGVIGRATVAEVSPFTLAFLRWGACAIILLPFVLRSGRESLELVKERPGTILALGFLGMWLSGAGFYASLQYTTATNATMIYTTSPLFIILLERILFARAIRGREVIGIAVSFAGVAAILFQGSLTKLLSGSLNIGDLGVVIAAASWAGYSIIFRGPRLSRVPIMALFGLVCASGALLLLPVAAFEYISGARMPASAAAWQGIAGIIVFSSLLAFTGFQLGLRLLGASVTGIFMYLMPVYGVVLAYLFLGERLQTHHVVGIALVLGGVLMATLPSRRN